MEVGIIIVQLLGCIFVGMALRASPATHEDKYGIIENKKQALESLFFYYLIICRSCITSAISRLVKFKKAEHT